MPKPLLALAAVLAVPSAVAAQSSGACDKACLTGIADGYVAAIVAHDPKRAALARNAVTVENLARIQPGAGLWKTAGAGPTTFRIVIADPQTQAVGYMAVMQEGGKPIQVGIRLRIANRQIVEAEHIVVHTLPETSLKNLQMPRAAFHQPVPLAYRDAHDRLIKIAADYYDALDENNGRLAPFADDCVRIENGMQTARNPVPADRFVKGPGGFGVLGSLGCEAQIDTGAFTYITRIENRRVFAADEELGLAVGFSHFHHAQTEKSERIHGVPGEEVRDMSQFKPFDMPAMHIYKIWDGKLHEIEALGYTTTYNSPTGWEK